MRLRIILPVLIVAVVLMAAAFYFSSSAPNAQSVESRMPDDSPTGVTVGDSSAATRTTSELPAGLEKPAPADALPVVATNPVSPISAAPRTASATPADRSSLSNATPTASAEQAELQRRLVALRELGTAEDTKSLETLLAALQDPAAAVRAEALEAVVQFGSRDAIPTLRERVATTTDPREQVELLEAIEFLGQPSFSERRARLKQRQAAPPPPEGIAPPP